MSFHLESPLCSRIRSSTRKALSKAKHVNTNSKPGVFTVGVGVVFATPVTVAAGVGVDVGCIVGVGAGVAVDAGGGDAPVGNDCMGGVSVDVDVDAGEVCVTPSAFTRKDPLLMAIGISLYVMSFSVVTFRFNAVEVPGLPTEWKVTLAKTMSPLTPSIFHADIITVPELLS